ncbi:MBL fold metallo-hydrolase [Kitasatospora sp. NBC_01287]|uniref:MBL fold metallo-hydrolase n=1 Tax=Kitasatospora sp. NBC_01287 TaxID=2903573 RepID=UPI00224F8199|nr:MBL fold metallo-hydrolase [Kitasatospora sp. NBC_01287]MCX4748392.1 MBL fold metallo-hydrolase [Kitasatospora sp. NBC_01287]
MPHPAPRAQVSIGGTTVTYLPDGHGRLDPAAFFPPSAPGGWAPHRSHLDPDGWFTVSIGSFLVRTADGRALLVDLGLGVVDFSIPGLAEFRGGELLDSLAAEGLAPTDVDTVVFTHLHHDHVGWTTDLAPTPDGTAGRAATALTFPRARHLVAAAEWHHWSGTADPAGPDPRAVQQPLAERIAFVADGEVIAPGVRVLATPGHTPGHLSLEVTDPAGRDGRRLVVLGDVLHCQVQVAESHWTCAFDHDPAQAVRTRERLLAELRDDAVIVAGGHFTEQVFGQVLPVTARRAWSSPEPALLGR